MLTYVDSSVVGRALLTDESGHANTRSLLSTGSNYFVTCTLTRIEVTSLLVRAGQASRVDLDLALESMRGLLSPQGLITSVVTDQWSVEDTALELAEVFGLRALDALHVAAAIEIRQQLASPGEEVGFATRDDGQAHVAAERGFVCV